MDGLGMNKTVDGEMQDLFRADFTIMRAYSNEGTIRGLRFTCNRCVWQYLALEDTEGFYDNGDILRLGAHMARHEVSR